MTLKYRELLGKYLVFDKDVEDGNHSIWKVIKFSKKRCYKNPNSEKYIYESRLYLKPTFYSKKAKQIWGGNIKEHKLLHIDQKEMDIDPYHAFDTLKEADEILVVLCI